MASQRAMGLALIGSAIALFLFIAIVGSHASAANSAELRTALLASGYDVVPSVSSQYAGFSLQPQAYTVHNGDVHVQVELFEYASEAALQQDWLVVQGSPATPRTAGADLSGRSAYWNANSVLVVDFRGNNDTALALSVGQVFLSQTGSEALTPAVSSRAADTSVASVQPPHTGDADLLSRDQQSLPLWAGLLWAGLSVAAVASAAAGGFALVRAARH
ncbi:MAG TPA: hypothetical protein VJB57_07305 [Dehalococcoidia bacterium]|nr:hypothetical protein [Dehalococcoidia bacterium]